MNSTTVRPSDRIDPAASRRSLYMGVAGVAVLVASFVYAPWSQDGPILCAFRWLTGLPCPGCGLTRSFCAVAHGDLAGGFHWHIVGPLIYAGMLICVPLLLFQAIARRRIWAVNSFLFSMRIAYVVAAAMAAFQIYRLVGMAYSGTLWSEMRASAIARVVAWVFG